MDKLHKVGRDFDSSIDHSSVQLDNSISLVTERESDGQQIYLIADKLKPLSIL